MCYNEEAKIENCIRSVLAISDEVVVLDSYSTDKTIELAESLGARIEYHEFMGYIKQRELSIASAKNDWVLALDADEYLSPELAHEINEFLKAPDADAVFLNRFNAINGYFLRHGSWFPHRIIRLFRKKAVYCGGNPPHDRIYAHKTSKTKNMQALLMHHCNEDIHDRVVTLNNHSTIAARHRFTMGKNSNYLRLLLKPAWKFFVEYFIRLGFLDGFYGYLMAKTTAQYIYLRESKLLELNRKPKNKSKNNNDEQV